MKKFHIDLPKSPPPSLTRISRVFGWLPSSLRRWLLVQGSKPTERPRDVKDVLEKDPYTIEEVEQGKIWKVKYEHEDTFVIGDAVKDMVDMTSEECMAAILEEAEKDNLADLAKEDLVKMKEVKKMTPSEGKSGGYIRAGTTFSNMFVIKLNSGSLLLYSPVHVHQGSSLDKWIQSMGTVDWIVMGSSAHTLQLSSTTATFPDALVVGSADAEAKLKAVAALPRGKLDFDINIEEESSPRGLTAAKKKLSAEGVELHFIAGDCLSQALWVLSHNVLIELDILYDHHPECKCSQCDITTPQFKDPSTWNWRIARWIVKSSYMSHQDYGLPYYRFWFMDPSLNLSLSPPSVDGSSCTKMANSLRTALSSEFHQVVSVHHMSNMSREDFRKSVNKSWNWLDGVDLI